MGGDHADRGRGPSDAMGRTAEDARRGFRWIRKRREDGRSFRFGRREGGAREDGDGGSVTWLSGFRVGPTGRSLVVVRVLYAVANWQIGRQGGT